MRKRPAIRQRKVTPPRAVMRSDLDPLTRPSRLPVVRTPAPPAARLRPRLQLVTDDDAFEALQQAAYAPEAARPMNARFWEPRPILFAMVAAVAAVVALVTVLAVRAFAPGPIAEEPTSTTTLTSSLYSAPDPVKPAAKPIAPAPAIPVVDVHSLPAAPPRTR